MFKDGGLGQDPHLSFLEWPLGAEQVADLKTKTCEATLMWSHSQRGRGELF